MGDEAGFADENALLLERQGRGDHPENLALGVERVVPVVRFTGRERRRIARVEDELLTLDLQEELALSDDDEDRLRLERVGPARAASGLHCRSHDLDVLFVYRRQQVLLQVFAPHVQGNATVHDGLLGVVEERADRDPQDLADAQENGYRDAGLASFGQAQEPLRHPGELSDTGYRQALGQANRAQLRAHGLHSPCLGAGLLHFPILTHNRNIQVAIVLQHKT